MRLTSGYDTLLNTMGDSAFEDPSSVYPASTIFIVPRGTDRLAEGRRKASALLARSPKEKELVLRGVHPDLIELTKLSGKDTIGIAQVREVIHQAQFAPTQAYCKVCLLPEAEELTVEAANALLKILEDPPRGFVFLFLTENRRNLLTTIVSRSQVVHVAPSYDEKMLTSLISAGYSKSEAGYLASKAQKDDVLAQIISQPSDVAEARKRAFQLAMKAEDTELAALAIGEDPILQHAATCQLFHQLSLGNRSLAVNSSVTIGKAGREKASQLLDLMLVVCFSKLRRTVTHQDRQNSDEPGLSKLDLASWSLTCKHIQRAQRALERYTCIEAVLMWLLLKSIEVNDGGRKHLSSARV